LSWARPVTRVVDFDFFSASQVDFVLKLWFSNSERVAIGNALARWTKNIYEGCAATDVTPVDFDTCKFHWLWDETPTSDHSNSPDIAKFHDELSSIQNGAMEDSSYLDQLLDLNFIRIKDAVPPAIRFFVFISSSKLTDNTQTRIENAVAETVRGASGIVCSEIYMVRGGTDWILIDARADFADFNEIAELIHRIHDTGVADDGSRTNTLLCTNNLSSIVEIDQTKFSSDQTIETTPEKLATLLNSSETNRFEAKGSWKLNLKKFHATGASESDEEIEHSALKTICGFLNAGGGTLAIGLTESDRPLHGQPDETPIEGFYFVQGIEPGLLKEGFDTFSRHVTQKVRERMDSTAVHKMDIKEANLGGRKVGIIDVQPSSSKVFLDKEFYIREGASTRKLSTSEVLDLEKD